MGYNKKTILPFGESYEKHAELIVSMTLFSFSPHAAGGLFG